MGKLPGVLTMGGTQSLPETATFARSLIGTMKTATADTLKNAGPTASAQDQVGTTGSCSTRSSSSSPGTPGGTVTLRDGKTKLTIKTVFSQKGTAGKPVKTTPRREHAAVRRGRAGDEQAAGVAGRRTGLDRADPGRGERADGGELQPRLPGAVRAGFDVQDRHLGRADGQRRDRERPRCRARTRSTSSARPSRTTTAWRRTARARCRRRSTSPATPRSSRSTRRLPKDGMTKAAAMFGIGRDLKLSITAYGGQVPAPKDDVAEAASMIGQGTVTASPLAMSLVAGHGRPRYGDEARPRAGQGRRPARPPLRCPQQRRGAAHVRCGRRSPAVPRRCWPRTARSPRRPAPPSSSPGGKVITNAWMAGYRGDVAFAVIVEGGESGSHAAGPILKNLPHQLQVTGSGELCSESSLRVGRLGRKSSLRVAGWRA